MALTALRDVELRHLLALRAVADARSFGRAAERLGFTQSAVSQQIAALERAVGEDLFVRPGGPKPVELTPAGRLLLEHADAIVERLHQAEEELIGLRSGTSGRIVIGTYQSVSVRILPQVIGRLRAERPDIEVRPFESDEPGPLIERLVEGELDLSFVVAPLEDDRLEVRELCVDPFVLIAPAGGDGPGTLPTEALRSLPLIGFRSDDACQRRIEAGLRGMGIEPHFVFRSSDNSAVQAMVRAGSGQAVMPLLAIDAADPGIRLKQLLPPLRPRIVAIARLAGRPLPPAAERLVEIAAEVCAEAHDPAVLERVGA